MSEVVASTTEIESSHGYEEFREAVFKAFAAVGSEVTEEGSKRRLFRTDADPEKLWDAFLSRLPAEHRQHYNCRACQFFWERYGGLVYIREDGMAYPVLGEVTGRHSFFNDSVFAMCQIVGDAKITGPFISSDTTFGTPVSPKGWTHFSAHNARIYQNLLLTASQREAQLVEEYRLFRRSLVDYRLDLVRKAVFILKSEQFPGYEKGVGIAEWLLALLEKIDKNIKNYRMADGLIWMAVVTAPPGFTHLKNGMVGTLLDDLAADRDFEDCRRRWANKMNPLQYQRPQAAPSEGQIDNAEKVIEKLGIEPALHRKFAKVSDLVHVVWKPVPAVEVKKEGGVFGHLRSSSKQNAGIELPNQNISWARFERDFMPLAISMEIHCPNSGDYIGITTALNADAPPILQWDTLENRNPLSWYLYVGGSPASAWNLQTGYNKVTAIAKAPHGNVMSHHRKGMVFSILGIEDTRYRPGASNRTSSMALFPETLKSELHGVRSVIEAYSKAGTIHPMDVRSAEDQPASGLCFGDKYPVTIRVEYAGGNKSIFTIDRWE